MFDVSIIKDLPYEELLTEVDETYKYIKKYDEIVDDYNTLLSTEFKNKEQRKAIFDIEILLRDMNIINAEKFMIEASKEVRKREDIYSGIIPREETPKEDEIKNEYEEDEKHKYVLTKEDIEKYDFKKDLKEVEETKNINYDTYVDNIKLLLQKYPDHKNTIINSLINELVKTDNTQIDKEDLNKIEKVIKENTVSPKFIRYD